MNDYMFNKAFLSDLNFRNSPVLQRPTLRYGDEGEYVRQLQTELKQLMFYNGNIDGYFGDSTLQSVKAFQTNNKLTVDGVVGKDTWSALIYLYSPLTTCEATIHIVQPGDTLWSISRKYNTTVEEIMRLNNLNSTLITVGQELIVPGSGEVTPSPENIVYTVQKGDTLWSISRRFNTTVDTIKSYNNLTSNALSIGQKLIIPSTQDIIMYIVQKGDTLWSIANRHNTTVDSIKTLNNLSSNLLSIGQVLKIRRG